MSDFSTVSTEGLLDVITQLMEVFRRQGAPIVKIGRAGVEVNVEEFLEDVDQFFQQANYRLAHRMSWPCVVINKTDLIDGIPVPRFVPINSEEQQYLIDADERLKFISREDGIPVSDRPITQASDGFFLGVAESIFGRARSILMGTFRNPEVEIITNPPGARILFSKGYFFSTSRVFGDSNCKNQVNPQTYCFYKTSDTPSCGLNLWTIVDDEKILL